MTNIMTQAWPTLQMMHMMMGGDTIFSVLITNRQVDDFDPAAPFDTMRAGIRFQTTGRLQFQRLFQDGGYTNIAGQWLAPLDTNEASAYQVQATLITSLGIATRTGPALGSFHTLSVAREWFIEDSGSGAKDWDLFFEIRRVTGPILTSNSWGMNVEGIV